MLTKEQIQHLYNFCEQHYVYFYDVQVELVDHLAEAIEEEMKSDKKLSFEHALERVYARFGVMGFSDIVRERARFLNKQARRNYYRLIKKQFSWPVILRSLCVGSLFYLLCTVHELMALILMAAFVLAGSISNIYHAVSLGKMVKRTGKKFMLMQYSYQGNFGWLSLYIFAQLVIHSNPMHPLLYAFAVMVYFAVFVASNELSKDVNRGLKRDFPEVFGITG